MIKFLNFISYMGSILIVGVRSKFFLNRLENNSRITGISVNDIKYN